MTFKRLLGIAMSLCAVAVLVGSVGAGATRTTAKRAIDLSTNSAVKDYLRSHGISPRHVVVQRGAKNYAGARCPGKGWTCTRSHRVVQIASDGGRNTFSCAAASCVVVQDSKSALAEPALPTNTAKCIKTTGLTQSCSITQSSATANNVAIVVEGQVAGAKSNGLTQTASYTATIRQTATGGPSVANGNTACLLQSVNVDGSTTAKKGMPVTVTLNALESASIVQDSLYGDNVVKNAMPVGTSWGCDADGTRLTQSEILSSIANGNAKITQNQNATATAPNLLLDIKQNKTQTTPDNSTGENQAAFLQSSSLSAIAGTAAGPVFQTQSTDLGGLKATVNQFAHGISNSDAKQTEIQCEHAQIGPAPPNTVCTTGPPPTYQLTQEQHGPMRKDLGDSSQTGNNGDSFTVNQNSQQDNDTHSGQTNLISGGFHTDGTGTVSQTATVDGQTSTDTQGGSGDVSGTMSCTGSTCTSTPQPSANVLIAGTGDFSNPVPTEPNDNLAQALTSAGYSVTELATLPADLSGFGQVWWVDATPPTSAEQNQLIAFAQSGKGVYLTGERPCCEELNDADQSIVDAVVVGGNNITVGHQGDVCGCNAPLPVNPNVVANLSTRPHTVTTWTPSAPGGMAGVPDSSVFSYYQPDPSTKQAVAAAWDRASTSGNGRLVVFMDVNWPEANSRGANWADVAENVAFFLSGLTSPPTPPILQAPAAIVPAGPSLFGARADATPARATTATAFSGTSSTR